jgi:flagellar biosynthesis/type III secretory pathway M-ring protein FliF/YscJ
MARVLFGKERDSETNKIRTILADANIPYFFTDVGHQFSDLRDVLQVLSNSMKLPVMVDEGVTYIGYESIRKHCGEIL